MRDYGINKGLIQEFQTTNRRMKGAIYGFRQMFRKYLTKLNVGFYDPCCPDESGDEITGMRFNNTTGTAEFYDPASKEWVATGDWVASTTTTTTVG